MAVHSETVLYMDFQLFLAVFLWLKKPLRLSTLKRFHSKVRARCFVSDCSTKLHCLFWSSEKRARKQIFLSEVILRQRAWLLPASGHSNTARSGLPTKTVQNTNTTTALRWDVCTIFFLSPVPMDGSYTIQLYMSVLQMFTSKHITLTYLYI